MPYKDPIKQKEYFHQRFEKTFTSSCLDCGKKIQKESKRCKPCSKLKKYRNPNVRQRQWAKKINGIYLQSVTTRIRDLKEYVDWRMKVFKRDSFLCQVCQIRGKKLHAHHVKYLKYILIENSIDTIEKAIGCVGLWDLNNGITLCLDCHKLAHRKRK